MSDHFENRLRQLAQEQADAAPSPHPFESVRQRGEHGVELGSGSGAGFGADPGSRPDRRRWFAAAAALVLVVGAVVVVAVRTAEAPTSLSTGDPDAPLTTDPVDRPETTDTDTDPDLDPGDDSVYGSSTPTTSVEIPHEVLVDGASVGPVWSTSLANNVAELDELWAELAPGQPVPEVDMETNVVIHFGPAESGSCPFGPLGSVQFDTGSGYLFPELAAADPTVDACTDDANPHTIVVAVVWDVMWTPDGETIVLLTSDDDGYWLHPFAARPPLASGDRVPTGISFDAATALPPRLLFAGRGSSGELAVSVTGDDGTTVRFFDPDTLVEREELARPLPAGATSVRLAGDGSSLLWVEGDELWYQPAAEPPRPLGSGYRAAWFAT